MSQWAVCIKHMLSPLFSPITGNCSVSEHMCRNGRCVSNLITGCGGGNGNNPCGDWSDCDTITLKTCKS